MFQCTLSGDCADVCSTDSQVKMRARLKPKQNWQHLVELTQVLFSQPPWTSMNFSMRMFLSIVFLTSFNSCLFGENIWSKLRAHDMEVGTPYRFGRSLQETQRSEGSLRAWTQKTGTTVTTFHSCGNRDSHRRIVGDIGAFNSEDWRQFALPRHSGFCVLFVIDHLNPFLPYRSLQFSLAQGKKGDKLLTNPLTNGYFTNWCAFDVLFWTTCLAYNNAMAQMDARFQKDRRRLV